jgi:drug/metabolite transporter (DMT)-like permease
MAKPGTLLPALALVCNAFVWGVSWWPFRELQSHGLHPLWSTALIYLVSLACLAVLRPQAWRGFAGQPLLWPLVAAAGMTNVGFNWAVTVGDVVRVVLLFYLMPAWSVLLAWPLLGERPTAAGMARLALALAGVAAGGFCFALTNILLRKLNAVPAESRILAMFGGGAVLAALAGLAGMAQGAVPVPAALPAQGMAIAALLSLGFLAGNVALQYGAARLPAHATALIMLSEVVFASVSSVAAGAAAPTLRTWIGGALILAAAAWSAWPGSATKGAE